MGADAMNTRFNKFEVTAGNVSAPIRTPHVTVAATGDDMMQIAKCILSGGGICPNT